MDDVHLIAYGKSTEANCEVLQKAQEICLHWARTHGATFAPKKYELLHLTRNPKRFNMKATVDLGDVAVSPDTSIRVLGLHIDGKLRWGAHLATVKTKIESQKRALTVVAGSTWGATLRKTRQVYKAVVKPAMTYGAAIWHAPPGTAEAKMTHVKKLATEQNGCLRTVLGAYRATPIAVLEAESAMPSMQIALDQTVLRMQALRGTHPVTKIGNARIRKILCKKQRKRGTRTEPTPAEGKRKMGAQIAGNYKLD